MCPFLCIIHDRVIVKVLRSKTEKNNWVQNISPWCEVHNIQKEFIEPHLTCFIHQICFNLHPLLSLSLVVSPPKGELWRLEDDMEGEEETQNGAFTEARPRSQSPFSHFRARAAYLRKSVSADDHLDLNSDFSSGTSVEGKLNRGNKGKLKRKFVSTILKRISPLCLYLTAKDMNSPVALGDYRGPPWGFSVTFCHLARHGWHFLLADSESVRELMLSFIRFTQSKAAWNVRRVSSSQETATSVQSTAKYNQHVHKMGTLIILYYIGLVPNLKPVVRWQMFSKRRIEEKLCALIADFSITMMSSRFQTTLLGASCFSQSNLTKQYIDVT